MLRSRLADSVGGAAYGGNVLNLESRHLVLLTVLGVVLTLTGLAFLLVSMWIAGGVTLALGTAMGTAGYRSLTT